MGYFRGRAAGNYFRPSQCLDFTKTRLATREIKFKTGDVLGATSRVAGSSIRWLSYNTATTGKNALEIKLTQSGILAAEQSSRGLYVNINNESASAISGELTAGEFKVRSSDSDTASVKGIHVNIDAKANLITLARGIEISIDAGEHVHGNFDTVQGLRVAANWSGGILTNATGIIVEGPAVWTDGINFAGSFSNTIIKSVTTVSAGFNIAWLDVTSTGISGDITGLRPRINCSAASAGQNARAVYGEVIVGASKFAALAQGGLFHVSAAAANCTIDDVEILGVHYSCGASLTCSGNFYGIHATIQSKGTENPGGDYVICCLENEAIAGPGTQMDSFLKLKATSLTGGRKAAGYLIDAGVAEDLCGTAFLRLGDDKVMASVDHDDKLNDIHLTPNDGWIKVYIKAEKKYIALYDEKTS